MTKARRWDSFHSPYLFQLFQYCCKSTPGNRGYEEVEKQRQLLLHSPETILRTDLGAGSAGYANTKQQRIATIAKHSLSSPAQSKFVSQLCQFTNAKTILELGTSFGISTAMIAVDNPEASIWTVEGDPAIAAKARQTFQTLHLQNIRLSCAAFDDFLNTALSDMPPLDIILLDGDHRAESLHRYFIALRSKMHEQTIVFVDDLYWSADMEKGWKQLTSLNVVTQSVNAYQFGLLFFRPDFIGKEEHLIRLPWSMYS